MKMDETEISVMFHLDQNGPTFCCINAYSPTQFPHSCISATQIPPARSELQLTGCQGPPETELRFFQTLGRRKTDTETAQKQDQQRPKTHFDE